MTAGREYVAALQAGRDAQPGDRNPFVGRVVLSRLWMSGYQEMLSSQVAAMEQPKN